MLSIKNIEAPQILVENRNFLVVYKAPKMHSAPGKGTSLVEWLIEKKPESKSITGGEAGLINRLDFETQGLVLFAGNRDAYFNFLDQQNKGRIIKNYSALASRIENRKSGFPPFNNESFGRNFLEAQVPCIIKSYFRAFGPGRKQVRPVEETADKKYLKKHKIQDRIYCTEILDKRLVDMRLIDNEILSFRIRIRQGFRHQIRCHLAWLGRPVLNDTVYGSVKKGMGFRTFGSRTKGSMALRACGIEFNDPESGEPLHYKLPELLIDI